MQTKLSPRFWWGLVLFSLMGQVAWVVENMYLNVFIYKMFNASPGDISAMVAASAVTATVTTVLMGAVSDRVGRRKPFMCLGYILWGLSLLAFSLLRMDLLDRMFPAAVSAAAVGVTMTIVLDCIMTFFGSTANDAAFNAWLTDSTNRTNRGAAEGVNAMMPLAAILAVFGGFMTFDLDEAKSWSVIFLIIGTVVTAVGIGGLFLLKEPSITPSATGLRKNILYGFRATTVRENPWLYFHLGLFILFNIAIQIFMPYLILYYEVSLGLSNYVLILAPAVILASLFTVFWGRLYDRKGFPPAVYGSLAALTAGFILLYLFRNTAMVFVSSLLMMSGYLAGMAVYGAEIRQLTPAGKAGMLQGVRIFSQVLVPGVVGPWLGTLVLRNAEMIQNADGTLSFVPNGNIFLAAIVPAVLTLPLLLWARKRRHSGL